MSRELEIPISATYGLTEAASQVCTSLHEDFYRKPGSVGRPLLFTQVGIFSKDGQELPALEPGEIVVSGPTVMAGYDQNDETSAGILQDVRLHTGDIGYMDKDGDLWVLQREGDIIISGGENVYPTEVEAVLASHPAVVAACVIGIQDEEWGQRVAAAVVPIESGAISAEELLTYCRQDLAGYKLPRVVVFVNALPQTASGKIQRQSVLQIIEQSDPSSHAAIENM
jgi:O-succinylbenzoic acid--CoA ligase